MFQGKGWKAYKKKSEQQRKAAKNAGVARRKKAEAATASLSPQQNPLAGETFTRSRSDSTVSSTRMQVPYIPPQIINSPDKDPSVRSRSKASSHSGTPVIGRNGQLLGSVKIERIPKNGKEKETNHSGEVVIDCITKPDPKKPGSFIQEFLMNGQKISASDSRLSFLREPEKNFHFTLDPPEHPPVQKVQMKDSGASMSSDQDAPPPPGIREFSSSAPGLDGSTRSSQRTAKGNENRSTSFNVSVQSGPIREGGLTLQNLEALEQDYKTGRKVWKEGWKA
jgi:hypothetical protein